jgi:hemerythrin-like metal-binding protein
MTTGGAAMGFIKWNSRYAVHIEEVDRQHQKLIELINTLYDAMSVGRGKDVLGQVLSELAEYTTYHFDTEDRLFREYGYPDREHHGKEHDDLTAKTKTLKQAFDTGNKKLAIDVMLFLSNWLNDHILEEDKKYAQFLTSKGVR